MRTTKTKKKIAKDAAAVRSVSHIISACLKIMRRDWGLHNDLCCYRELSWILIPKFIDHQDQIRKAEAHLAGTGYQPIIAHPYRWRDWGATPNGLTGDALIAFIDDKRATLPDGTEGPGLFDSFRFLTAVVDNDRRDGLVGIFHRFDNGFRNGHVLRDVLNKIDGLDFTSPEVVRALSLLLESMLGELHAAADASANFYTPRPLVDLIVKIMNPRLGEIVFDEACGAGSFLAGAFEHMKRQCRTPHDHRRLQEKSTFGAEPRPLPHRLCHLNLLLQGVEAPQINPLPYHGVDTIDIDEGGYADVVMSAPPFYGDVTPDVYFSSPADKQTFDTALLLLQLTMRTLNKSPKPGRAAVVVRDGLLLSVSDGARIVENLLKKFNLHTIVRLPNGVFSPCTNIATNILFFDPSGPTREVWYYEHPLPKGLQHSYTRAEPLHFKEFAPLIAWWNNRGENEHAWRSDAKELLENIRVRNLLRARKSPRPYLLPEHFVV